MGVVISGGSLVVSRMWPMREYIQRHQATIAEYIVNHPIYERCTGVKQIPGLSRFIQWWYQYLNQEE